jgi:hypothetical protein
MPGAGLGLEADDGSDVTRGSRTPGASCGHQPVVAFLGEPAPEELRLDGQAGRDHVGGDATGAELRRDSHVPRLNGRLGGSVGTCSSTRRDRADGDDPAVVLETFPQRRSGEHGGQHVGVEVVAPVARRPSDFMEEGLVANTEYHNGGMRLCPNANPEDGVFDVLLIGDVTKRDLLQTLPKLYRGTHLPHPKAELLRGRTVTVEAASSLPIELDGEQPGTTPVRFEVVPGALRVRVPADA